MKENWNWENFRNSSRNLKQQKKRIETKEEKRVRLSLQNRLQSVSDGGCDNETTDDDSLK